MYKSYLLNIIEQTVSGEKCNLRTILTRNRFGGHYLFIHICSLIILFTRDVCVLM